MLKAWLEAVDVSQKSRRQLKPLDVGLDAWTRRAWEICFDDDFMDEYPFFVSEAAKALARDVGLILAHTHRSVDDLGHLLEQLIMQENDWRSTVKDCGVRGRRSLRAHVPI